MTKPKAKSKVLSRAARTKKAVPTHRVHLLYSGRVQNVGFRHTAEEIGLGLGLVGWVRNLHDNRVEIVAEGSKEHLESLLDQIRSSYLAPHIKKCDCRWEKPTGEFSDFCVEFCF